MSHSKMCPFFSSQAWAASHNGPGAQAPHLAGLSAEAAGEYLYAGEFGL